MYTYYFVLGTEHFLVNEEPVEEILKERTNYYENINKEIDFWLIMKPDFLDISQIEEFNRDISKSYAAIVSLDKQFIQWLKLRIGFVVIGSFQSEVLLNLNTIALKY